jgi:hypothetical protein
MASRLSLTLLLSCSVYLLVNCGNKTGARNGAETNDLKRITLHVKDMAEFLDLT